LLELVAAQRPGSIFVSFDTRRIRRKRNRLVVAAVRHRRRWRLNLHVDDSLCLSRRGAHRQARSKSGGHDRKDHGKTRPTPFAPPYRRPTRAEQQSVTVDPRRRWLETRQSGRQYS
jgi:hypothetical protein